MHEPFVDLFFFFFFVVFIVQSPRLDSCYVTSMVSPMWIVDIIEHKVQDTCPYCLFFCLDCC